MQSVSITNTMERPRNKLGRFTETNFFTKEQLDKLYNEEKLSLKEIGQRFDRTCEGVRWWFLKFKIKRRLRGHIPNRNPLVSKEQLFELYVEKRMTLQEIGSLYRVDLVAIQYWMKKYDLPRRTNSEAHKGLKYTTRTIIPRTILEKLYLEDGLSSLDIAEKLHCSKYKVLYWMTYYGLPRRNSSEAHKGQVGWLKGTKGLAKPNNGSFKKGQTPWNKGKKLSREHREKVGAYWKDPKHANQRLQAILKALIKRPNKLEKHFMELCELNKLPFRYVGDGDLIIGFPPINPDFVHNSEKKAIEIFGHYWHHKDDEEKRKDAFKKMGWESLILWEDDFRTPKNVVELVKRFEAYK